MQRFVIVGAGLAGHTAALELSQLTKGSVLLVGEEVHAPYDRPPLSKEFLASNTDDVSVPLLGKPNIYEARGISLKLKRKAVRIFRESCQIQLSDGERVPYDRLLLAVGSSPIDLPCSPDVQKRIHKFRTYEDARRLCGALLPGKRLIVVGGGLIGLEVAAAARARNMEVTILEATGRLASRSVPAEISHWLYTLHTDRGILIELNERVSDISIASKRLVVSTTTKCFEADEVLVCVGIRPNVTLASNCGLLVHDGIVVDEKCRTSDHTIFAAGEATNYPVAHWKCSRRMECWKTAATQPVVAARAMVGVEAAYRDLPWFWSDQFGNNIQIIGLPDLAIETRVWPDVDTMNFGVTCVDADGFIVAAAGINSGGRISMLRKAIEGRQRI